MFFGTEDIGDIAMFLGTEDSCEFLVFLGIEEYYSRVLVEELKYPKSQKMHFFKFCRSGLASWSSADFERYCVEEEKGGISFNF